MHERFLNLGRIACKTAVVAGVLLVGNFSQMEADAAEVRTWTSKDGRTFEGELLRATNSEARIKRKGDGKIFTVELARLSQRDLDYIRTPKPGEFKQLVDFFDGLAAPTLPSGATGPDVTVSGQVFITTKGGSAVKLSSVEVCVVSADRFNAHESWWFSKVFRPVFEWRRHSLDYQADRADGLKFLHGIRTSYLGKPAATTTTDADGRFVLKHAVAAPFTIYAQAQRLVGGEMEYYTFALASSECPDLGAAMLSNAQLIE